MSIPDSTILGQLLRAERQLEKATTALKVIHLWAAGDDPSRQSREKAMQDISNKALSALAPEIKQ